jgi:hypothetical protein
MKDGELLTATVTPKGAHLREMWCWLYRLTLLDRLSPHRLTFYLAVYPLFSPFGPPFPRELYTSSVYVSQLAMQPSDFVTFSQCRRGMGEINEEKVDEMALASALVKS